LEGSCSIRWGERSPVPHVRVLVPGSITTWIMVQSARVCWRELKNKKD